MILFQNQLVLPLHCHKTQGGFKIRHIILVKRMSNQTFCNNVQFILKIMPLLISFDIVRTSATQTTMGIPL